MAAVGILVAIFILAHAPGRISAHPHASVTDSFRRITAVCSTCTPPSPSQGLRVQRGGKLDGECNLDGNCGGTTSVEHVHSLADCATQCEDAACVGFGFLAGEQERVSGGAGTLNSSSSSSSNTCELYFFTEQYTLAPDDDPWQYWLRLDTPGVAPAADPAKRAVPALLAAPTGGVALDAGGRFARSMSISEDYLLRNYQVDNMLWWFRHRAGLVQPNPSAAPQGWDRCVDNKRGGVGHLCLKGSVASTFLMGAGGHLRWSSSSRSSNGESHKVNDGDDRDDRDKGGGSAELRRRFDAVLAGIEEATTPAGFAAAFAENETMYRENPDYVLAWLTHGLLEANVADVDHTGRALKLARGMIDWFSSLGTNWLLPEFMPADRTTRDVPPTFGANTGHMIYLISQGIIHHARMATSALGRQRDVDTIAKLYQEDEWLSALAAKDEKAVWQKRWFPHNYEVTAFEAYLDMWSMTGNASYKAAVDGAWEMFRASFLHVGGSMALNEGSNGTNLSSGLWYPPKSYYLEGVAGSGFQNHTGRHKTGETCGSVFWVKLNQRYHYHFPRDERYVGEIERSLLNIGIANQAAAVGAPFAGVRSFALLHGAKNVMQNISTCCEGQGTRLHNSLPEYVFSLNMPADNAAGAAGGAAGGAANEAAGVATNRAVGKTADRYAGVSVDIYTTANITFDTTQGSEVVVAVRSTFPYFTDPTTSVMVSFVSSSVLSAVFEIALRIPAWVATPTVSIALNGQGGFAVGTRGSYVSFHREWRTGDTLTFELPPALRATKYVGLNQVAGTTRWAYELGPVLLTGRPTTPTAWDNATDCLHVRGVDGSEPASWLVRQPHTANAPLRYTPRAGKGHGGQGQGQAAAIEFVPYFDVGGERMTTYPCYS